MRFYTVSKNRYYYFGALCVGPNIHWDFTDDLRTAKFFAKRQEAEYMLNELNSKYKGILDNYKGQFKVRCWELTEVK